MGDLHFWSSAQSRRGRRADAEFRREPFRQNYALINGQSVAYDVAAKTQDHGCLFTDMVYLGRGAWLRCEVVR